MKRILPLVAACVILTVFVVGYSVFNQKAVLSDRSKIIYYNTDTRNFCAAVLGDLADNSSILLFGSSELSASDNVAYPPALFNGGNSDYNIIMVGRGTMQSLHHAITLGAVADDIENKKVVLILSPQWFTASHLSGEAYASRFSERLFSHMVKNKNLSYETKRKLADRAESLLETGNPEEYRRVLLYDKVYIEKNASLAERLQVAAWDIVMENKQTRDLLMELEKITVSPSEEQVVAENIDYQELLKKAEQAGVKACTNNNLYIYDYYYTTYIESGYFSNKGVNTGASYLESPEYDDLELFFKVCEDTGITPLIVNIPVNGIWYDWTGFPQASRKAYYQKIRDICMAHGVSVLDFSDKEYEPYFLKDIMHLGWKGWAYLNEGVYRYYLDHDKVRNYPFEVSAYVIKEDTESKSAEIRLLNYISDVSEAQINFDSPIKLTIGADGYLRGVTDAAEEITKQKTVNLEGVADHGAGIRADVTILQAERMFLNRQLSAGCVESEPGKFIMTTETEDNQFNAVVLQVYDSEGSHIANIDSLSETGYLSGTYVNQLDDGIYTFVVKGNSNKADQTIASQVALKHGDVVKYQFDVSTFLSERIEIRGIDIFHVMQSE